MSPHVRDLAYRPDASRYMERLLDHPWPVWLDSGRPFSDQGRFDILTAAPVATLVTRGADSEWCAWGLSGRSSADPFELLSELLGPKRETVPGLPFIGGAIGYFGYDLARRFVPLPNRARDADRLPELMVGIYDWALILDHVRGRACLVGWDAHRLDTWAARLVAPVARPAREPFQTLGPIESNLTPAAYLQALRRIREYLIAGDCYQVNLAQRFAAPARGDPWTAYQRLRALNAAPFGAYLDLPGVQILCASPERFLQVRDGWVETRPIKGTRPRADDPAEDARLVESLRLSPKERAENVMIVDLLRNDLGRVCAIGSIQVPALFEVETFAHVHHLVSTVRGRLAAGRTALDLLRAAFPGGSITGAPKRRAMEIIEELEPDRRGVYCGAIGYLGFDGAMDTNIVIRTLIQSQGVAQVWAGGGIVIDSDPASEYRETYHKAAPLLELLQSDVQHSVPLHRLCAQDHACPRGRADPLACRDDIPNVSSERI
ncbi:aminodeoxychorismate synthase component I [Thermochromatium tepidum]|uniref:aminodeoxychorismate synthase n=1 Tax=Thermochromatium tepidum ATCC 43061 TaxID=316276 RepID=A0A6I6E030_THETI|nr:aminodeoxychorismate synthase component I [Thermochromatium tepidum]QGU33321.1 aminodeoxychorismate synthase component I [Thermochromatium tepidum ATCC 43061]